MTWKAQPNEVISSFRGAHVCRTDADVFRILSKRTGVI
jgi:hypothetical protein